VRHPENSLRGAENCSEHYSISKRDSAEAVMQDVARRALSHYCSVLGGVAGGLNLKYYPHRPSGSTGGVVVSPVGEDNPKLSSTVNLAVVLNTELDHALDELGRARAEIAQLRDERVEHRHLEDGSPAGFIREVLHPEWLANPVLVLKKDKVDWRMCVDYTDLNKHCPEDPFGLPRIDQVVDSTAGCSTLSFLDCYSGYHQISPAKEDEEYTAFTTPFGAFCYTSMSFGLKNAGATYQKAIQTCLADHWGKRVEAYIDDVVIKTENSENFIEDLQLVFNRLRRYRWKLNPEKCVFGVPAGKLLEFIVSHRVIEANPAKIEAIMRMEAPRSQKKVQRLTGCMAALSRFISRMGEKGMPFYKLLKKVDKFQWTTEAQEALDALKKFLTTPPVLKPPRRATPNQPVEDLLLYISCTTHVVSTALVVERVEEGHTYPVQHPVYFISEVLGPSKMKYPQVQKLLYMVLLTARKLRHYFDDHKVIVVTGFPIGDILHNKEAIGRTAKWACELGAHDIEFRPCTVVKTQALVDFISEWTEHQVPDNPEAIEVWQMYFDGSLKL
jgi:hypothetical protein